MKNDAYIQCIQCENHSIKLDDCLAITPLWDEFEGNVRIAVHGCKLIVCVEDKIREGLRDKGVTI